MLSDSRVNSSLLLSGLCLMSVPHEKISKEKQGFIEKVIVLFRRDPRCLQLLFLSNADKSC